MSEKKRTQILLVLYDNEPETNIDIQELADMDFVMVGDDKRNEGRFRPPSSIFQRVSKIEDGRIMLFSYFEKDRNPKEFRAYVQGKLEKNYGKRFQIQIMYHLVETGYSLSVRVGDGILSERLSRHGK